MNHKELLEKMKMLAKQEKLTDKEVERLSELSMKYNNQQDYLMHEYAIEHAEYPVGTRLRHMDGRIGTVKDIQLYGHNLWHSKTQEKLVKDIRYLLTYPKVKTVYTISGKDISYKIAHHEMRLAKPNETSVRTVHKVIKIVLVDSVNNLMSRYMLITEEK